MRSCLRLEVSDEICVVCTQGAGHLVLHRKFWTQQTLSLDAVGQSVSSHTVVSVLVSALFLFDVESHYVA